MNSIELILCNYILTTLEYGFLGFRGLQVRRQLQLWLDHNDFRTARFSLTAYLLLLFFNVSLLIRLS